MIKPSPPTMPVAMSVTYTDDQYPPHVHSSLGLRLTKPAMIIPSSVEKRPRADHVRANFRATINAVATNRRTQVIT